MIHLTLIRHGETAQNAQNICQGQSEGFLNEKGQKQAELLGERLKNETIDVLYRSDMERTRETALPILKYHPNLKVIEMPILRERAMGKLEGKVFPETFDWEKMPVDMESNDSLFNRAETFLKMLLENEDGNRVVVVSHGGLIRAFWTVLARVSPSDYLKWDKVANASITNSEVYDMVNINMIIRNDISHLESL